VLIPPLDLEAELYFREHKLEARPIIGVSMDFPFTIEQFFDVFEAYNTAIWPAQIIAYLIGIVAVALSLRENRLSGRIVSGILALFWIWMGVFYHMAYFSAINPAAWVFGALFILEGLLFIVVGSMWCKLSFSFDFKPIPIVGVIFILYAMVVYPLLGIWFASLGQETCSDLHSRGPLDMVDHRHHGHHRPAGSAGLRPGYCRD
jgi:hypothetical protein